MDYNRYCNCDCNRWYNSLPKALRGCNQVGYLIFRDLLMAGGHPTLSLVPFAIPALPIIHRSVVKQVVKLNTGAEMPVLGFCASRLR